MYRNIFLIILSALLSQQFVFGVTGIETSYVGDIGNANDSNGYGGVSYGYHIGTYEVTTSQYATFLNSVAATDTHALWTNFNNITRSGSSGSYTYSVDEGFGNKPVDNVTFWNAARFCNWLTTGGTETGVYNLNGVTNPTNSTITRNAAAWAAGGVAVASENEWYKAAYYQPVGSGGDVDSYWLYPTASNSITTADANYDGSVGSFTDVGTYADDPSYYGTFDQGGNIWEFTDTILLNNWRVERGGDFSNNEFRMTPASREFKTPDSNSSGFRVSSLAPIPEPSAYAAILGCLGLTLVFMRRKERGTL